MKKFIDSIFLLVIVAALSACAANTPSDTTAPGTGLKILAVESFLADITRNVAGERASVETLIPLGIDPHAFEPTPKDVARVAGSDVLVVNGAGFEEWLDDILKNAGGRQRTIIVASNGLTPRPPADAHAQPDADGHQTDPHFWFDPLLVIKYVENIRDELIIADPAGKDIYTQNAQKYVAALQQLNEWAVAQVGQIPPENRILITNHESFGYFADRYGFTVTGAVLPSVSSSASPSAKHIADLIDAIRQAKARAIFLETGSNPEVAQQIAAETGAKVVTGLYSHSLSEAGGPAPTYIEMMRYNISLIVSALK